MSTGSVTSAPVAGPVAPQGRPMPPASAAPSAPQNAAQPSPASPAPSAAVAPSTQSAPAAVGNAPSVPSGTDVQVTAPAPATPRKRRGRKPQAEENRVFYPGLNVDADNKAQKLLEGTPADYDVEKHLPLRKRDFIDESTFLIYKAERYEKEAAQCRKEAEELKKLGTGERQKQAKQLEKMISNIVDIETDFNAAGIDVEKMIADIRARVEAKAKEAKAAKESETAQPAQPVTA